MNGIVLAAGAATRMPNKALLPMKDLRPVICSGIDYLIHNGVDKVIVLVSPDSPLPFVLRHIYDNVVCVFQEKPTGTGDALRIAFSHATSDIVMVVCCDNIYPADEIIKVDLYPKLRSQAVIRLIEDERILRHLALWNRAKDLWTRDQVDISLHALTTPWTLIREEFDNVDSSFRDVVSIFNEVKVKPLLQPFEGWWDIGTPEMFRMYWSQ